MRRLALVILAAALAPAAAQPSGYLGTPDALPPMPHPRHAFALVAVDGLVYAVGGVNYGRLVPEVDVYDPKTNAWSTPTSAPTPREAPTAAAVGGKIFLIGGSLQSRVEIYDPKTNSWANGPMLPRIRKNADAAWLAGKLYVAGGSGEQYTPHTTEVDIYDPRTGAWTDGPPLQFPRGCPAMSSANGKLWIIGGDGRQWLPGREGVELGPSHPLDSIETLDARASGWKLAGRMPQALMQATAATVRVDGRERVYAFGGSDFDNHPLGLAGWVDEAGWHDVVQMPTPRYVAKAAAVDGVIYVAGGTQGGGYGLDVFEAFDTRTGRWRSSRGQPGAQIARAQRVYKTPQVPYSPQVQPQPQLAEDFGAPAPARPDDYALIIGVERYRSVPQAQFSERDAASFKSLLTRKLGVPEENVIFLTGQSATHTDLAKYVEEWLPRNVTKDSRVYFYYSGHGAPDPQTGSAFLLPWDGDPGFLDTSGYPMSRLLKKLGALPAQQVLVMLDSCFSGTGGRSVIGQGLRPLVTIRETKLPRSSRVTLLSAATGAQTAGSFAAQQHGLFTYYVLKGLSGEADLDHDGHVDVSELHTYVHRQVRKAAHRENREQDPQLQTREPDLVLY